MLSEVVPSHMRATVMATEFGLQTAVAAICGGPIVGWLAEYAFGYRASTVPIADTPATQRADNARALQLSLAWMTLVPWAVCFLSYLMVGYTYQRDRERALAYGGVKDQGAKE